MNPGVQPRRDLVVKKPIDQIVENMPFQPAVTERRACNILPVDMGKMDHDVTGVRIEKHVPRLAFIGDTAVGVERKAILPQDFCRAAEIGQFVATILGGARMRKRRTACF
jgi:hypothetical protein